LTTSFLILDEFNFADWLQNIQRTEQGVESTKEVKVAGQSHDEAGHQPIPFSSRILVTDTKSHHSSKKTHIFTLQQLLPLPEEQASCSGRKPRFVINPTPTTNELLPLLHTRKCRESLTNILGKCMAIS